MPSKNLIPQILIAAFPQHSINYRNAVKQAGFNCIYPSQNCLSHPYILAELTQLSFDLLILPGGGDFSQRLYSSTSQDNCVDYITDLLQFQLLQIAYMKKKPILGICKGMQMINVFFGGTLYPHLPTAHLHTQTALCSPKEGDLIHPVFFSDNFPTRSRLFGNSSATCDELYRILAPYKNVNSAHHQGIHTIGKNLVTIQYSEDYLPETIAHRLLPILGFQWHPERLECFSSEDFKSLINILLISK